MKIKIAERLHPFSHLPGASCLLPFSPLRVQVFPTLVRLHVFEKKSTPSYVGEVSLDLEGPIKNFTVQQNLEKGEVSVWGNASQGYFHYRLFLSSKGSLCLKFENIPAVTCASHLPFELKRQDTISAALTTCHLQAKDELMFAFRGLNASLPSPHERLSLGNHKSQDWDMVKRRGNMEEIFPACLRLAALTPASASVTSSLLEECRTQIDQKNRNEILEPFSNLFAAGFEGILSPRAFDSEYQGFAIPITGDASPLALVTEAAQLIRSLFLQIESQTLKVLPCLPTEFHAGRGVQWNCPGIGILDFEWSKKELRRMVLRATETQVIHLKVQHSLKKMRVRMNRLEKGKILSCDTPIEIQKDQFYLFDNFQH